jgi:sulfide:quinone oxidoreductase
VVDKTQRNPAFPNVFGIGVCVAVPPIGSTPVPTGVVTATARNIGALLYGKPATSEPTWNAVCLADFGDSGVAFVAEPQIPPRNLN